MQETVQRRATYADLEAAPPHLVAELLHGRLVTHPQPSGRHAQIHFRLGTNLGGQFEDDLGRPGGWRFLTEPELHLGEHVCVPELAGWRIERIPVSPAPDPLAPVKIHLVPDWVCEVLSPSTEKYDRHEKREIYAAAGIGNLWLVDPRLNVIEAFVLAGGAWTLAGTFSGNDAVRIPPFNAIELSLARIWPPVREGASDAMKG